jgi:hypothetical protein
MQAIKWMKRAVYHIGNSWKQLPHIPHSWTSFDNQLIPLFLSQQSELSDQQCS